MTKPVLQKRKLSKKEVKHLFTKVYDNAKPVLRGLMEHDKRKEAEASVRLDGQTQSYEPDEENEKLIMSIVGKCIDMTDSEIGEKICNELRRRQVLIDQATNTVVRQQKNITELETENKKILSILSATEDTLHKKSKLLESELERKWVLTDKEAEQIRLEAKRSVLSEILEEMKDEGRMWNSTSSRWEGIRSCIEMVKTHLKTERKGDKE